MKQIDSLEHPWVDAAVGPLEDAAVLRPSERSPLVFTVDFITPIVDDPVAFGAIAAANSLSDVYAMGGEPRAALAICGFPTDKLPMDVLQQIFRGGRDKAAEAGCAIVGGHTVKDGELKYGLCVIGVVEPGKILTHNRARPGDVLVLTKPLGLGIASQAIKKQKLPKADIERVIALMSTLNKSAKDAALAADATAATDVTGFGLIAHVRHLLLGAGAAARIHAPAVPVLDFAADLARAGFIPGGSKDNLSYVDPHCRWQATSDVDRLILNDAQTSGGLLIAVPQARTDLLVGELERLGAPARAVIGEIVAGETGHIDIVA